MDNTEVLAAQVFKKDGFGKIRTIVDGGAVLFVAVDVAMALGYRNPRAAISRHCKGVAKRDILTNGGMQAFSLITEGDLYRLIVHSKLPAAEDFERWVFEEVLPTIRRTGSYTAKKEENLIDLAKKNPEILTLLAKNLLSEQSKSRQLEAQVCDLQPKAEYYDTFVKSGDCSNIRTTAKELEIPEKTFVKYLLSGGFLYRSPSGTLLPYALKKNDGLFKVRDFHVNGHMRSQTLITPKGKKFFNDLLYGGFEEE